MSASIHLWNHDSGPALVVKRDRLVPPVNTPYGQASADLQIPLCVDALATDREACMNLELQETDMGKQWVVVSIYKDYCDPAAAAIGDEDAEPEESRNC